MFQVVQNSTTYRGRVGYLGILLQQLVDDNNQKKAFHLVGEELN